MSDHFLENIPGLSGSQNLSAGERAVSLAIGFGLMGAALKPRPNKLLSLLALVSGAGMAIRGATGHCAAKAALEQSGGTQITHG